MTTPILEIENLNGSFPSKQVLHDINLTLQPGRKLALVGESGSGKTVLSQGIMRLNPMVTFEGSLKYCGTDLLTQPERALQKLRGCEIGMVFQEPMTALNPVMRVANKSPKFCPCIWVWIKTGMGACYRTPGRNRHPPARAKSPGLSFPTFRRPTPTRYDCHGRISPAQAPDCRRTDHRFGRCRPSPNSRPALTPAGRTRHDHALHYARLKPRAPFCRRCRRYA